MALKSPTLTVRLDANTRGFQASLDRAAREAEGFGRKIGRVGKAAALGLAGVGIAGAAAATKFAADFLKAGDALDKMSKRTGVSVEQLQKLDFAAQQSGSDLATLEKAFQRQARVITDANDGLASATDSLDALGLSVTDLEGLAPDQQFAVIADALSQVDDAGRKAALAQKIFGRSGAELIPLLDEGAAGIAALTDQAAAAGNIMSTKSAEAAAKFNDQLNVLKQGVLAVGQEAFAALIPYLLDGIDRMGEIAGVIRDQVQIAVERLQPVIAAMAEYWTSTLLPALQAVSAWIQDHVVPVVKVLADVIRTYVQISVEFWSERMDFLIELLRAAWEIIKQVFVTAFEILKATWDVFAGIFTGDWQRVWDAVKDIFAAVWALIQTLFSEALGVLGGLWREFGEIFGLILDAIKDKFVGIWESIYAFFRGIVNSIIGAIEAIPNAFARGLNSVIGAWNSFSIRTPEVKVLGRVVVPSIRFDTPDIATIPTVSLPRLAQGGIVRRPTVALLGESGPEAVIPLGSGHAGQTLNVYLMGPVYGTSGTQFADEVVRALTEWQRVNGSLPTALLARA